MKLAAHLLPQPTVAAPRRHHDQRDVAGHDQHAGQGDRDLGGGEIQVGHRLAAATGGSLSLRPAFAAIVADVLDDQCDRGQQAEDPSADRPPGGDIRPPVHAEVDAGETDGRRQSDGPEHPGRLPGRAPGAGARAPASRRSRRWRRRRVRSERRSSEVSTRGSGGRGRSIAALVMWTTATISPSPHDEHHDLGHAPAQAEDHAGDQHQSARPRAATPSALTTCARSTARPLLRRSATSSSSLSRGVGCRLPSSSNT